MGSEQKNNEVLESTSEFEQEVEEIQRLLAQMYPGKIRLSVNECAEALGLATGTIYNQISRRSSKPFPIKPVRIGGRPGFLITDIAKHLSHLKSE